MTVVVFAECWEESFEFAVVFCIARVWSVTAVGIGVPGIVADGAAEEVDGGACHYERLC